MSDGPAGVIIGGWPYVIAAYTITALALAASIARLVRNERSLEEKGKADSNV